MSKVIMTCGKICCGKTTYAKKIRNDLNAVILSIDEFMLALFGQYAGEKHDEYVNAIERILLEKSVEIVRSGTNVILDWGLWTRKKRCFMREFYNSAGIECEIRYIEIADDKWKQRIDSRNALVTAGKTDDYYIDEALMSKAETLFEIPDEDEVDMCIKV